MRLIHDAGFPQGVVNFVSGGGRTVGETFTVHPDVRAISFTGSSGVGRSIHAKAATIVARTQLELGGKNPEANMGPVCGEEQLKDILDYIRIGREEGARLLCGGERLQSQGFERGCYIPPTLFDQVTPKMRIAREEIFGPVLSLMRASDYAEAVEIANNVEFGLAASIFTRDLNRAMRFVDEVEVGLTHINIMTAHKEPQLSFGGVKASGFGLPEAGQSGLEFFTEHRSVYMRF